MVKLKNTTTIQISKETHHYLQKKGAKGETFDQIIASLLQEENKNGGIK
jgi:hypothetical protein